MTWGDIRRRLERAEQYEEMERLRNEPFVNHLSEVDEQGRPRHPRPQLTPEELEQMEAKRREYEEWANSEEGISAIAAEQVVRLRRQPPGQRRLLGLVHDLRTEVLIQMSVLANGAAHLPPSETPAPEPTEPTADVLSLPGGLNELPQDDEEGDYDDRQRQPARKRRVHC